jgi:hypothetical protein
VSESHAPEVLIVDDGELVEVRALLDELGANWRDADGGDEPLEHGARLLVTNSRVALRRARVASGLHVVIYDSVSRTLRRVLERSQCDLVLASPVDPNVMRLLVDQARYQGPERRRAPRAVVASPVRVRRHLRSFAATLVQLSMHGCRLLMDRAPRPGARVRIELPPEIAGGEGLELAASVERREPARAGGGQQEIFAAFRAVPPEAARRLAASVARHSARPDRSEASAGAPGFDRGQVAAAAAPRPADPAEPRPLGVERRRHARRRFTREVLATGRGGARVLIGSDLSVGGMRVQSGPELEVGQELKLALHVRPGLPSVVLRAAVARDDGPDGFGLRFVDVSAQTAAQLEKLVASLRPVAVAGRVRPGVLVSELIETGGAGPAEKRSAR